MTDKTTKTKAKTPKVSKKTKSVKIEENIELKPTPKAPVTDFPKLKEIQVDEEAIVLIRDASTGTFSKGPKSNKRKAGKRSGIPYWS